MVTIQLDPIKEQRLRELAASRGEALDQLAQRIIEEYLDTWTKDTQEDWAEASVALAPEVMAEDAWEDGEVGDGSR